MDSKDVECANRERERGIDYLRAVGTPSDLCKECSECSFKLRFPSLGDKSARRFGDYLLPKMRRAVVIDGHIYVTIRNYAETRLSWDSYPLCALWRQWYGREPRPVWCTTEDERRPGLDTTEGVSEVRDGAGTQPMEPVNGSVSKQNLLDAAWLHGYVAESEVAKEVADRLLQDLSSKVKIL